MDLKEKTVLVVGLGKSGIAACRYLVEQGARVIANDLRNDVQKPAGGVECLLGSHDVGLAQQADLVVVSPGIPLHLPMLIKARERNIPIVGEMELAIVELTSGPASSEWPAFIAITGTNGKTTTTMLIAHLLKAIGKKVCVAGNIGTPLLSCISDARHSDWVVLEVSSFQLETTPSLHPRIAVWLNTTPDHLDWHASFADYVAAKRKIFEQLPDDGCGIYNDRDAAIIAALPKTRATLIPFHSTTPVDWDLTRVKLEGVHNRENTIASLLAVQRLVTKENHHHIQRALESFTPPPHRLQFIREVHGVRYYDDSKGTNVGATVKALESFSSPVVLIAGGRDKGGSYDPLCSIVREKVKLLVLIGEAAAAMDRALGTMTRVVRARSMEDAVMVAHATAVAGDVVMLSPACSSFDMFRDYAHRGQVFQEAVNGIAQAAL